MKKIKSFFKSELFKLIIIFLVIGLLLTGLWLLISDRYDLMGWTNAVTFTALLYLGLLWLSFASSKGIFDMIIFGVKSFWNGFKRNYEKLDYFEYRTNKEKPTRNYYISLTVVFVIFIIPAIILLILVMN